MDCIPLLASGSCDLPAAVLFRFRDQSTKPSTQGKLAVIPSKMPDLNSLPPSRPPSISQSRVYGSNQEPLPGQPIPSPRASSVSLAAAATINAGIQNQESRRSSTSSNRNRPPQPSQRRSSVAMNLSLNDPTLPGPGELQTSDQSSSMAHAFRTSSPRSPRGPYSPSFPQQHHRTPSLGELHQELEQESEAQVVCHDLNATDSC